MAPRTIALRPEHHADLDRLATISGENVHVCMQCGTCSAVCPMVDSMKMTTRHAMHLLQFGDTESVQGARIGDFCASCHTCSVRCPRGIDVARVFEAVRLLELRANKDKIRIRDLDPDLVKEAPQIAFVSGFRKLTA